MLGGRVTHLLGPLVQRVKAVRYVKALGTRESRRARQVDFGHIECGQVACIEAGQFLPQKHDGGPLDVQQVTILLERWDPHLYESIHTC
jgi:hypothetical protein